MHDDLSLGFSLALRLRELKRKGLPRPMPDWERKMRHELIIDSAARLCALSRAHLASRGCVAKVHAMHVHFQSPLGMIDRVKVWS